MDVYRKGERSQVSHELILKEIHRIQEEGFRMTALEALLTEDPLPSVRTSPRIHRAIQYSRTDFHSLHKTNGVECLSTTIKMNWFEKVTNVDPHYYAKGMG